MRAYYPAEYRVLLAPELLDRCYGGMAVEVPTLLLEFRQAGHQFTGRARQALRNAAYQVSHLIDHWRVLAHFVRELYLLPDLSDMRKQEAGSFALGLGLHYLELTEETWMMAAGQLEQAFLLLPAYRQEMAELLQNAWHRTEHYQRNDKQR